MDTTTGRVKWFDDAKGYGFISRDDGQKDVFVHFSKIKTLGEGGHRSLEPEQRVSFGIETTGKGPQATDVVVTG